ncbi:UDP-2,4-diacetamido-2,4,6-trideoxy-beta-L-altropyranose hydrolase [Ideonella sp. A 288]|uniref:UDP-2,4-diacetamido-2,4, 6-trideoxy-beta-L-altropyranose hydrolase n=1 Tax=Ideonella sp. A 288 TaxID=1962181 RepID=UPI000B4B9EFF|nr:UDP-2,4-diacetamido-2,4,6-trideoxy-beta-L-altropyranose hydrolase [Ideonella sp. A 288]
MRVMVRADASTALGWGHVKRCLALAQALRDRGADVRFVSSPGDLDVPAMVAAAGFGGRCLRPTGDDAADTLAALGDWAVDAVVVDHYRLAADWHQRVRAATGACLAVIDDLADRPLAPDLLIDHNPAPDHAAKYRAVLQCEAELCGGPRWALLDAVYADHARHRLQPRVRSLGVFMGGTDADDVSSWAVWACRHEAGWSGPIEIASTSGNPSLGALQALSAADAGVTLLLDQPNLADFHVRHDLQIGAGGGATWERCCLGVPAIVLVCADNQRHSVPWLAEAGAALTGDAIGRTPAQATALAAMVRQLIDSAAARETLHRGALALVDGQGARRVADRLLARAGRRVCEA